MPLLHLLLYYYIYFLVSFLPEKHVVHFNVEDHWKKKKKFAAALIYAWQWVDGKAMLVILLFPVKVN